MQGTIEFVLEECCNCGIPFYMTKDFYSRRSHDHKSFYCPAGHSQHYTGKTEAEKLRERLELVEKDRDYHADEARRQRREREAVERSRAALKGQVTKANNKLKKGICPCCETYFPDLEKHIAESHDGFDIEIEKSAEPKITPPTTPPSSQKKKRGRPRKVKANETENVGGSK